MKRVTAPIAAFLSLIAPQAIIAMPAGTRTPAAAAATGMNLKEEK